MSALVRALAVPRRVPHGPAKSAACKHVAPSEAAYCQQLAAAAEALRGAASKAAAITEAMRTTIDRDSGAIALQASLAKHGVSASKLTSLAGASALTPAPLDVFSTLAHPSG